MDGFYLEATVKMMLFFHFRQKERDAAFDFSANLTFLIQCFMETAG
jgi:hypothetical protein